MAQWIRQTRTTLIMTSLLTLLATSTAQCPTDACECRTPGPVLYCRSKNLNNVPQFGDTSMQFTEVTLARNDITTLGADAFKTSSGVGLHTGVLDLTDNQITSIDDAAFAGLEETLEVLKLDVSGMTSFPTTALAPLVNLRELYLSGFAIAAIPDNALSAMTSLRIVSFENCGIESVSNGDFANQRSSLQELHLSLNELSTVPVLNTLTALQVLNLHGNDRIRTIGDDAFNGLSSLQTLALSQMGVSTINANAFNSVRSTLRHLSLSRNGDNLIHSDLLALQQLSQLRMLELNGNGVTQIPLNLFQQMSRLEELDFQDNAISALTDDSFDGLTSSLRILNLAGNNMQQIEQFTFEDLSGLTSLTLDDNPSLSG